MHNICILRMRTLPNPVFENTHNLMISHQWSLTPLILFDYDPFDYGVWPLWFWPLWFWNCLR